uniref:Putative secreted protein n=1 Tax=Anopheles darlingi TaxID=43151 RepID=A0A2M4D9Y6_ANODA
MKCNLHETASTIIIIIAAVVAGAQTCRSNSTKLQSIHRCSIGGDAMAHTHTHAPDSKNNYRSQAPTQIDCLSLERCCYPMQLTVHASECARILYHIGSHQPSGLAWIDFTLVRVMDTDPGGESVPPPEYRIE